jgi:hypothetical protein
MQRRVIPLITGIPFVALVVVSIFTGPGGNSATNSNANPAITLAYFQAPHAHYAGLSALLITLAVTIGLFFFASVRDYLRRDEAQGSLAGTAFGGAIIFGASGALSAGALLAISDSPKTLLPATAQMLNLIQNDVSNGMQAAGLAVFFLAAGIAVIRSRLLPLWWGWVTIVLGLVAASVILSFAAFIGLGVWAIVTAIMMYRKLGKASDNGTVPPQRKDFNATV